MKIHKTLLLAIFCLGMFSQCTIDEDSLTNCINPVIGDISAYKSGTIANNLSEEERITTHLKYVESVLRKTKCSNKTLQNRRNMLLNVLLDYIKKGDYPSNYDHPEERKPCFIDKNGNICAVGYLIEQSAGRKTAEYINSKFQYTNLLNMHDALLDAWINQSGFSKMELAMIQPTYGGGNGTQNELNREYGIASAMLGGASLGISMMNASQINKNPNSKFVPVFGIITGLSQLTLGLTNYPNNIDYWGSTYVNKTQRDVSMLNIGLGTTTLFLSTWNLVSNKTPKKKKVSWNAFSYPTKDNRLAFGLSFSKRF